MRRLRNAGVAVGIVCVALAAGPARAVSPPEPPDGGDVAAGAEPAGLDAVEWEAAMRGSASAASPKGALTALASSPNVDMVVFYKNLDGSAVANADDAYHVIARRPRNIDADPELELVLDHLVYTRSAAPDGGFTYQVISLSAENPVGAVLPGVAALNPFGAPTGPGPVIVPDGDDAKRDPKALASLAEEIGAASRSVTETAPATEAGVVRHFVAPDEQTYPYPYERLASLLDDSDAGDLIYFPTPSGHGYQDSTGAPGNRGNHASLDVSQSRSTLIVSGRGARRTPLSAEEEAALALHNVDVAPTVAKVLGMPELAVARFLNGGTRAENPSAPTGYLARQDGRAVDALLEPRVNTFVIVIDGMEPQNVNPALTPNLCRIARCPGTADPDPDSHATVYEQARAMMVTQTNANHTAMLTGAYGDASGLFANSFYNRALGAIDAQERPELILTDTLFDAFRAHAPQLATAAVLGKQKLRTLYDCTRAGADCGPNAGNPEGLTVSHVRPDFLRGASMSPDPALGDCQVVQSSVPAPDACIMDEVIELSATQDPDFTFVNLGMVDVAQHGDGPGTALPIAAIAEADRQIGRLVEYLKESGKWDTSVLIVTADHSFSLQGPPPAQRIDLASLFNADRSANPLAWGAGLAEPFAIVSNGGTGHVYLRSLAPGATTLSTAQRDALTRMRRVALESSPGVPRAGVSEALYRLPNGADPAGLAATLAGAHPDWHLATARAGELVVTTLASGPNPPLATGANPYETASGPGYVISEGPSAPQSALLGDHGHPGARHVPFIIASGGDFVLDQRIAASDPAAVNEGDDTASLPEQAEPVDIAATVAWIYGLVPAGDDDATAVLPAARGRVLREAFAGGVPPIDAVEPHANRAVVMLFDGNNVVRIQEFLAQPDGGRGAIGSVRSLLVRDTDARIDLPIGVFARYGTISGFPSTSLPNHNVVGSSVLPGHHGIVGNNYYERDIATERDPVDVLDPRNPLTFFSSGLLRHDFETLHEAVHRAFGDWSPTNPGGAFTASVNEPSARGADFAATELTSSETLPAAFVALAADPAFLSETNMDCANEDSNYQFESVGDHAGTANAIQLYQEPQIATVPVPGLPELVDDSTQGASHPDPKYLTMSFALTDGASHAFGPHSVCGPQGYRDTALRLGRVLGALRDHSRFDSDGEPARIGETFFVLTGDHGHENQDLAHSGGEDADLAAADIEYVRQGLLVYLLTLDVAVEGADGLRVGSPATLTFTVRDSDRDPSGVRQPLSGAKVSVAAGAPIVTAFTDAQGRAALTLTPSAANLRIVVDRDANPAAGGRTVGSTSPNPAQHGIVPKSNYNDRVLDLPVGVCDPGSYSGDDCDGDGALDAADNCAFAVNPDQADHGGVATTAPDGIGDACQCGDVSGNGIVNGQDANAIRRYGLGADPNAVFRVPGNCDVNGNGSCNGQDGNAVSRAALGLTPNPTFGHQLCPNANPAVACPYCS